MKLVSKARNEDVRKWNKAKLCFIEVSPLSCLFVSELP